MFEILQPFQPLILLFVLIVLDFVTGTIGAIANDTYDSSKMRKGLLHMLSYVFAIGVTLILEEIAKYYDLGYVYATSLYTLVYVWIVVTEVGSILENLIKINPSLSDNSFMKIFANQAQNEQASKIENKAEELEAEEKLENKNKVGF